jgi:AcrR family transcriptional regulator
MEIKEQIVMGATELYMRYGIKSVTMDDISRHLGMSKKTIYQYFEDKDALVTEVSRFEMNTQKCRWEEMERAVSNVIEFFILGTKMLAKDIGKMNPTLLFDLKKFHPIAYKEFVQHKRGHIKTMIVTMLERGIKEGYFRKDINVEILATLRIEQIDMAFNPEMFDHNKYSVAEITTSLFEHFIYGISTLKGHQKMNEFKQIIEN